jgi:FkbM family methyltransferase
MTFISYAQNFEDIVLWRMFRICTDTGFYIDVGANDPTFHSVTKAFYDRGWRGVNIEPSPKFYKRLCEERSRDINLQIVVSNREEKLTFFDTGVGLSTVNPDIAAQLKQDGRQIIERALSAQTLTSICERYADGEIHFLKVDVEGHEASVLQGMDFERWRPWILLIESPFNIDPEWRSLVEGARYREVRRDGVNRYFLAEEHMNLIGAFDMPPGFLDDFRFCYGHHFSHPVTDAEAQLAFERNRADAAEAKLAALDGNIGPWLNLVLQIPRRLLRKLLS